MVIKIVSTEELFDRSVIKCIQTDNTNKKMSKFQVYQTKGLEHRGINIAGRK